MPKTVHPNENAHQGSPFKIASHETPLMAPSVNNLFNIPIHFFDLLDEVAIGVLILDTRRRIVVMNQHLKALTGFSQKAIAGIDCAHIMRSNVCLQDCPVLHISEKTGSKCMEGNLINQDRQIIPIRITSAPIKNMEGRILGFLETIEDIRLLRKLDETAGHASDFNQIIGRSPEMEKIFQILPSLAQTDSSILITGETGTGKDMVAEAIHHASNRAKGPFVKINCGALPETLLESELFGHRKGAFTGAVETKPGRIQLAHNGTLYLTEIGDLPLSLQVKLLTFLDDKEVFPLGSIKGFTADVRIIAATHRNLEQRVNRGGFRRDLLFRLNVIRLHLPPLRERQGDIQLLLTHFLNTLSVQLGKQIRGMSDKALKMLLAYHYPGNVRELRNIVEYAVNICSQREIQPKDLPSYLTTAGPLNEAPPTARPVDSGDPYDEDGGFLISEPRQDWSDVEKRMILQALVKAGGRKNKAAGALGWARSTLWRKMKRYGIG